MKLFGYEWLKLWQRRLFMVLAVLLLAGNLLTLYILEKNTSAFFYVYENRELYQAFRSQNMKVQPERPTGTVRRCCSWKAPGGQSRCLLLFPVR